jgi:hypothetical protein
MRWAVAPKRAPYALQFVEVRSAPVLNGDSGFAINNEICLISDDRLGAVNLMSLFSKQQRGVLQHSVCEHR